MIYYFTKNFSEFYSAFPIDGIVIKKLKSMSAEEKNIFKQQKREEQIYECMWNILKARQEKNWKRSDWIRDCLVAMGYRVEILKDDISIEKGGIGKKYYISGKKF